MENELLTPKEEIFSSDGEHEEQKGINSSSKTFTCDKCKNTFANEGGRNTHTCKHERRKRFSCDVCGKTYFWKTDLKTHMRIHTGERPYSCSVCSKSFHSYKYLVGHKIAHSTDRPYKCECGKTFKTKEGLSVHSVIHTGVKPYVCKVCKKSFRMKSSLTMHQYTHTGERPYKCPLCGLTYITPSSLKLHKFTHTGESPFECEKCHKGFPMRFLLNQHYKQYPDHNPDTPDAVTITKRRSAGLKCKICNEVFSCRSARLKHNRCYHPELCLHHCDVCSRAFRSQSHFKEHLRIHSGDLYKCETCGKESPWLRSIKLCQQKHAKQTSPSVDFSNSTSTAESNVRKPLAMPKNPAHTELRPHQCTVCYKAFKSKSHFNEHLRIHSGDHFECEICGKKSPRMRTIRLCREKHAREVSDSGKICDSSLTTESRLVEHTNLVSHQSRKPATILTDENSHQCLICNKRFQFKKNLKRHRKNVHKLKESDPQSHVSPSEPELINPKNLSNQNLSGPYSDQGDSVNNSLSLDSKEGSEKDHSNVKVVLKNKLNGVQESLSHPKPHQCLVCNKRFHLKSSVKRHLKTVHKLKDGDPQLHVPSSEPVLINPKMLSNQNLSGPYLDQGNSVNHLNVKELSKNKLKDLAIQESPSYPKHLPSSNSSTFDSNYLPSKEINTSNSNNLPVQVSSTNNSSNLPVQDTSTNNSNNLLIQVLPTNSSKPSGAQYILPNNSNHLNVRELTNSNHLYVQFYQQIVPSIYVLKKHLIQIHCDPKTKQNG